MKQLICFNSLHVLCGVASSSTHNISRTRTNEMMMNTGKLGQKREWKIRERINLMNEMNPSSMRTIKNSKFHSLTWASRLIRIPSERVPTSTRKALGREGNKKCFIDFWPRHGGTTRAIVRDSSKSFFVHVNYVYKAHWWNARLKSELDITHFHTYTWWSRARTHGALMRWSSGHSCLFSRSSCATFR